jgi:hypothetical protein
MEKVYVPKTPKEKAMQRALLQYFRPQNREIVLEALKKAGRRDLIGSSPKCLVEDIPHKSNGKGGEKSWQKNQKGLPPNRKNSSKISDSNFRKAKTKKTGSKK